MKSHAFAALASAAAAAAISADELKKLTIENAMPEFKKVLQQFVCPICTNVLEEFACCNDCEGLICRSCLN